MSMNSDSNSPIRWIVLRTPGVVPWSFGGDSATSGGNARAVAVLFTTRHNGSSASRASLRAEPT